MDIQDCILLENIAKKKNSTNEIIILGRLLPITSDKVHQNQEVYANNGIAPTCKATHFKDPIKVIVYEK